MQGKPEGKRRRGWMASPDMSLSKFQETVKDKEASCVVVHGVATSWTQLRDRTATTRKF